MVVPPLAALLALATVLVAPAEDPPAPLPARYVRVELAGTGRILSLAEVEVFVAGQAAQRGGVARQSSVASGGVPERAADGTTNGTWQAGSVTHTEEERDPWWELDLGAEHLIDRVVVWNRTDCCDERLEGFTLQLLDARHRLLWERKGTRAPRPRVELVPFTEPPPPELRPTLEERLALQPGINAAIDRGLAWLRTRQQWDGSFAWYQNEYPLGTTALALYTLLESGVSRDDLAVRRAEAWLVAHDPTQTYEFGVTLMALAALGDPAHEERIERLADRLLDMQGTPGEDGKKDFLFPYPRITDVADLSNGQYAALGLLAAQRAGVDVPDKAWKAMLESVLRYQEEPFDVDLPDDGSGVERTTAGDRAAGFPYRVRGSATASMTTAGLGMVGLATRALDKLPLGLQRRVDQAERHGVNWLVHNFSVEENRGGDARWLYYYLYGLERVGALFDLERLGPYDWYYEGAKFLVRKQEANGSWTPDDEGNTCFALLFLMRATSRVLSGEAGGGSAAEAALWLAEDPAAEVRWRATGSGPLVFFLSGFDEDLVGAYGLGDGDAHGLRIRKVEWLVDGEVARSLDGDPRRKWTTERFPWRAELPSPGRYRCSVRVHLEVPSEDGLITVARVVEGDAIEIELTVPRGAEWLPYARHAADNLLRPDRVAATASSSNQASQGPAAAVDGYANTAWVCQPGEAQPTLSLTLADAPRGQVLLLAGIPCREDQRGTFDRATRVRVRINKKDSLTFELDAPADESDKLVLELDRPVPLRQLELTILDRVTGSTWKGQVGFNEVQWLEEL